MSERDYVINKAFREIEKAGGGLFARKVATKVGSSGGHFGTETLQLTHQPGLLGRKLGHRSTSAIVRVPKQTDAEQIMRGNAQIKATHRGLAQQARKPAPAPITGLGEYQRRQMPWD